MQISLQEVMFLLLEWFGANFAHRLKKEAQSGHTIWQQFHSYEFSIHLVARKLFSTILVLNCLHVKNFASSFIGELFTGCWNILFLNMRQKFRAKRFQKQQKMSFWKLKTVTKTIKAVKHKQMLNLCPTSF